MPNVPSTARGGTQSFLKLGNGASPQVYTTIGEVTGIDGFGVETALIKVTNLESTAEEYIGGLPDGVQFDVPCNYNPVIGNYQHNTMLDAARTGATKSFQFLINSSVAKVFSFNAVVMGAKLRTQTDSAITMVFTLKISGSILGPN